MTEKMLYFSSVAQLSTRNIKMAKRNKKGSGSIIQRGGVWHARWIINGQITSKTTGIRVSEENSRQRAKDWLASQLAPIQMANRKEALEYLAYQIRTTEERIAEDLKKIKNAKTASLIEEIFRTSPRRPDCSDDMLSFYCGVVRRFVKFVGENMPIHSITNDIVGDYARNLAKEFSAGTYNKAINALRLVWRVCGREMGADENPWNEISHRRSDAHIRRSLSQDETDAIYAEAKGEMKVLIAILLYTGLRLGDACQIKWGDFKEGVVYVVTSKRDKKVAIPIHPKLAEVLGERKANGYVMPEVARRYQANQGSSNVSRSIKRLMERCGIQTSVQLTIDARKRPDASAHSFRHTFVTRAIEAGVPPHIVQAIVGHSSAIMTERYTHLSDKAVLDAFAQMK